MSELKATTAQEIIRNEKDCDYMDELFGGIKMPPTQVYLKSEADKVIAEKYRQLRHSNYKRCLAMASTCRLRARWFGDNAFYKKEQWALNWHNRWLELAEKFKEAK